MGEGEGEEGAGSLEEYSGSEDPSDEDEFMPIFDESFDSRSSPSIRWSGKHEGEGAGWSYHQEEGESGEENMSDDYYYVEEDATSDDSGVGSDDNDDDDDGADDGDDDTDLAGSGGAGGSLEKRGENDDGYILINARDGIELGNKGEGLEGDRERVGEKFLVEKELQAAMLLGDGGIQIEWVTSESEIDDNDGDDDDNDNNGDNDEDEGRYR